MLKEISVSRQYAPLRVCADICFYFFAVSLFSFSLQYYTVGEGEILGVVSNLIAPWSLQLALLVAACFALGFLIVRIDKALLRFLLSLLPGLSFLMSPLRLILLIHAVAWLYFVIVMTIGSFEVHLDEYRRRAGVMLLAALLMLLCLIIFHFGTEAWYFDRLFGGELYGPLFFVLCVLSLRGMRTDLGAPVKMRLLDALCVVVLPTLLFSVLLVLYGAVPAVTGLFRLLVRFVIWLYHVFFPTKNVPYQFRPPLDDDLNAVKTEKSLLFPNGRNKAPDPDMVGGQGIRYALSSQASFWIMVVLLAALLVYIAIRLIRRREKLPAAPRLAHENIEKPPLEGLLRRAFGEAELPANVRQIRRVYRSYLKQLRTMSVQPSPSDTSEDILDLTSGCLDMPENAALRELYIAARYGDPKAVTSAQVSEAKRCLSAIEAKKRRRAEPS